MKTKDIKKANVRITKRNRAVAECFSGEHNYSTANFIVYQKSGHVTEHIGKPCHGVLKQRYQKNTNARVIFSATKPMSEEYEARAAIYYDWLLNHSVYKDVFLEHSVSDAVYNGVWVRTDVPSNLMVGALIATRYTWDKDYVLSMWFDLVGEGVDKDIAFIAAHIFREWEDSGEYTLSTSAPEEHSLSVNHMTREGVDNFLAGDIKWANDSYNSNIDYRGVFGMWGGIEDDKSNNYPTEHSLSITNPPISDCTIKADGWVSSEDTDAYSLGVVVDWCNDVLKGEK